MLVCQQHYNAKTIQPIFTKFGGKVAHGPRKEPLDFGGNLNHVTQCLFNSNNSRTSSALVKDMLSTERHSNW